MAITINGMTSKMIGFVTKDGKKHLGFYAPVVDPFTDAFVYGIVDRAGRVYDNVEKTFDVNQIDVYYWDKDRKEYCLLPQVKENDQEITITRTESMRSFATIQTHINDNIDVHGWWERDRFEQIREWLILCSNCKSPVYINEKFEVFSDDEIIVKDSEQEDIPEYIKFGEINAKHGVDGQ